MEETSKVKEVRVTRLIDATPEEVFTAWTDQDLMREWWRGDGFSNPVFQADAREGGEIRTLMRSPQGEEYPMRGRYVELARPGRVVISTGVFFDDMSSPAIEALDTVTIAKQGEWTRMDVHAVALRVAPAAAMAVGAMEEGWNRSADRLVGLVERIDAMPAARAGTGGGFYLKKVSDTELVINQTFDAPRESVFGAMTDRALIPQWWGPDGQTMTVESLDLRPGGEWRFSLRSPDGKAIGFHGTYLTLAPPAKLVYTFENDGAPGRVCVESVTFVSVGERTVVTDRVRFRDKADLEGIIGTGMEAGARESWERLAGTLSGIENQARARKAVSVPA